MSRRRLDSPLPCSKVMSTDDYAQLAEPLQLLDQYPGVLAGQHAVRRWEYAMAHHAITAWQANRRVITVREGETTADEPNTTPLQILDVGGAGSNFWQTLTAITSETVILVDPNHKQAPAGGAEANIEWFSSSIEDFAAATAHMRFDVATCISVVEHVDIIRPFFRAIHMLLKPGGLLFLTTDFWDSHGPDVAHFHWMRKRIYNEETIKRLLEDLRALGFRSFGESDWSYHGHQLYDYSIASAAMVRK